MQVLKPRREIQGIGSKPYIAICLADSRQEFVTLY